MQIQQISARTGQFRGVWLTGTFYNYGDIVQDGANGAGTGNYYMCIISNTSGVWATDLAAGDWTLVIDIAEFTTVAGGTNGQIQYNNGGELGGLDSTGSGLVARQTSPTFITPVLGVASGTSLNLSGLTISSAVATDSSKNLVSVTNTGTGNNVLSNSPTFTGSPVLSTPTVTTLNGLTITTTNGTLTLANGSSLITSGANSITLTSAGPTTLTLPTTGTLESYSDTAFKVGSTTYDISTTGSLAITGVGFKPRSIMILATVDGAAKSSNGFSDGTAYRCMYSNNTATWTTGTVLSRLLTDGSNFADTILASFDSDGFTLTKSKFGSPTGTGTISYHCTR